MRTKQRYAKRQYVWLVWLFGVGGIAAQNQTLLNHQRSRNLNREGYWAYRKQNWNLALQKFAQSMKLDPYYTYPIYNTASVLSLRGRPQDSYRIYHLLLEVLLRESGEERSIHQAKMQKDPDLAWFRRHKPELFILLNNVILNYNSQEIYRRLRRYRNWKIQVGSWRQYRRSRDYSRPLDEHRDFLEPNNMFRPQTRPPQTPEPSTEPQQTPEPQSTTPTQQPPLPEEQPNPFSSDFDPFSSDDKNPFEDQKQEFPGDKDEEKKISFAWLRQQYPKLTFHLIATQADEDFIIFEGHRYVWHLEVGGRFFEMRGFFAIRGNVLILETFASSPEELKNLPFDWGAFRSLFFIYQPQIDEFHAISTNGEPIRIY